MAQATSWAVPSSRTSQRAVAAVHDYPNRRMHQVDEKWQLNFFLGEWLRFCLQQGRATACELPFLPAG